MLMLSSSYNELSKYITFQSYKETTTKTCNFSLMQKYCTLIFYGKEKPFSQ